MTQEPEQPKLPNPNGKDWVGLDFFQFRLGWVEFFFGFGLLGFLENRNSVWFSGWGIFRVHSRCFGFLGFIHVVSLHLRPLSTSQFSSHVSLVSLHLESYLSLDLYLSHLSPSHSPYPSQSLHLRLASISLFRSFK